jgi:spore maturation protein CgeB
LAKTYKHFSPDLVLLIRGIGFQNDVLNEIKRNTPLFGWWIEREERIEEALKEINLFDWYFFINSSCVEEGLKRGRFNVSLLHHSVDPLVWHPVDAEKKYDWSFVGGWSAKRQEVIERALKVSVNAALYGPRWGKCCRFNSPIRRILKGDYIEGDPLLRLYSETRVVLNITNWGFGEGEKRSGMNMRVLEVPACGAFLLTDGSRDMSAMVRPGEHGVVYEGLEDFEKKLGYYLKNHSEREKIATAGRERVSKNYTYDDVAGIIAQRYASLMAMVPV